MKSETGKLVDSVLKHTLDPVLRADGFTGARRTYRRCAGELIHVFNVQGSRYGGEFFVNLGVHLTFLPNVIGQAVDPKRIDEPECEFRTRMSSSWVHGADLSSIEKAVTDLVRTYENHGRGLFAMLANYPADFARVTPAGLENHFPEVLGGFGSTIARMSLVFARIHQREGSQAVAKSFAELGLAHLGQGTGLRAELQRIRDGAA